MAFTNSASLPFSQTVGATVQLGVTDTLLVDVGVRKDVSSTSGVQLVIGGTTLVMNLFVVPTPAGVLPLAHGVSGVTADESEASWCLPRSPGSAATPTYFN